jgi:hypothetical protein
VKTRIQVKPALAAGAGENRFYHQKKTNFSLARFF